MLQEYPKEIMCRDGTPILIRPLVAEDEAQMHEFLCRFPPEERWFLRDDVSDPAILHRWICSLDYRCILPLVAVKRVDGAIIANVRIHRRPGHCLNHIGHLRIMVDPAYRHQRLGTWMLLDAIRFAMRMGIEKLVAEFVEGVEESARQAAHRLDFFPEAVVKDYAKDPQGNCRNLVIMVKTLRRDACDF